MELHSRLRGGIYGVAVGDALGATVEFMSRKEIRSTYGRHKEIIGGGWLRLQPGEYTAFLEMLTGTRAA
ncbi:MAG: ADP-ribosylglycohydrolase family protein [Bacillota bacterium]|jgi:ADP-ribosyl-[dinitrogen reductase] hydrolase